MSTCLHIHTEKEQGYFCWCNEKMAKRHVLSVVLTTNILCMTVTPSRWSTCCTPCTTPSSWAHTSVGCYTGASILTGVNSWTQCWNEFVLKLMIFQLNRIHHTMKDSCNEIPCECQYCTKCRNSVKLDDIQRELKPKLEIKLLQQWFIGRLHSCILNG